jgi:hypothetical protein
MAEHRPRTGRLLACGGLAALAFLAHAAHHIFLGSAWDVLWLCNVAPIGIAIGCLARRRSWVAVALLWETFGSALWLIHVAAGASWIPTSPLVHLLCPVLALLAARELGWPRRAALHAVLGMAALVGLTRAVAPPPLNVNVAFAVMQGWEGIFPRYDAFAALVFASASAIFWIADRAATRCIANPARCPAE